MREPYLTTQTKRTQAGPVEYWAIRWWDSNGKKRSKSLGRTDKIGKQEAKRALRRMQTDFERTPRLRNRSRVTIEAMWQQYKQVRGPELAPATLELYETAIGYLQSHFGEDCLVERITPAKAGEFKSQLAKGKIATRKLNAVSVNLRMRNLKAVFNFCQHNLEIITSNPFKKHVQTVKVSKDWHYITQEEFESMQAVATGNYRLLIALCRLAALRRLEAYYLEWSDINFDKGRLYVCGKPHWQPKDRETRCIPICPELMALLTQAFDEAPEGAVRVCPAVCIDNIDRDIKNTIKRAGVAQYKKPLHSMRKSCITDWAEKYPIHAVKEWAGHSSITTTEQHYLRVNEALYDSVSENSIFKRTENVTENEKGVTESELNNA